MIGRASIGYPWIFNEIKHFIATGTHSAKPEIEDRIAVCRRHLSKSIEWKGEVLGVLEMRRHYANYFKGTEHFKEYRMRMVTLNTSAEIHAVLDEVAERYVDVMTA